MANDKEIKLTLTVPEQKITVWGNIDRLKQVLTNLLDNTINHSEAGGAVCVELGRKNNDTYISVKNSGPGIPREEHFHPLLAIKFRLKDNFKKVSTAKKRPESATR